MMLDLFSGLGGASEPFRLAGWPVVTVDIEPAFAPDIVADISAFSWSGPAPLFVWASPPCTEFARESMPWSRTGRKPSTALVEAAIRIIRECGPLEWALENVRGSIRAIDALRGPSGWPMRAHRLTMAGPVAVWSSMRPAGWPPPVEFWKEKLSSTQRARRAKLPPQIAGAFVADLETNMFCMAVNG